MAGATVINTGGHSTLLTPDMSAVHFNGYARVPMLMDKIAKISESNRNYERESEISGLPGHQEKDEGEGIIFEFPVSGNDVSKYHTTFALGFQITEEMREDELFGIMEQMGSELGKSAAYSRELKFWDLFNSGFATHTTLDGQYIFDTDHTTLKTGSSALSNDGTAAALSETTLQAGFDHFDNEITNHAGVPEQMTPPYKLIIPHALRWTAKDLKLNPWKTGTANNTMNTMESEDWDYLAVRHLTSATAFFLLSQEHDMRFIWRSRVKYQQGDDFASGNQLHKSRMRFATWCPLWKGSYGNAGA
jgi:hypothetical protein